MGYRETVEDGKGNVIEEKILYTLEQYKEVLLREIKQVFNEKFPPEYKQRNAALGLLSEEETAAIKTEMANLLADYSNRKIAIGMAQSLDEAHNVVHG